MLFDWAFIKVISRKTENQNNEVMDEKKRFIIDSETRGRFEGRKLIKKLMKNDGEQ